MGGEKISQVWEWVSGSGETPSPPDMQGITVTSSGNGFSCLMSITSCEEAPLHLKGWSKSQAHPSIWVPPPTPVFILALLGIELRISACQASDIPLRSTLQLLNMSSTSIYQSLQVYRKHLWSLLCFRFLKVQLVFIYVWLMLTFNVPIYELLEKSDFIHPLSVKPLWAPTSCQA